jgi:ketosteroid isomerase-like protein
LSPSGAEVLRELSAAINADDQERLAQLLHPDVVQYGTRGGIDQDRVFRGREAVLAYWQEIGDVWESQTYEPERVIEAGDAVVVLWLETARSRHSDLEVETNTAGVVRFQEGKIIEITGYMDRDEALEAAGLTDEPD